jgi:DNA-binding LacI/PurR family transcriptional regulator
MAARAREETRRSIIELSNKYGFRTNRSASEPCQAENQMIGFITLHSDLGQCGSFFHAEEYFRPLGYQVLIADSRLSVEREKANIDMMLEHRAEGFDHLPDSRLEAAALIIDHLLALHMQKIPLVLLGKFDVIRSMRCMRRKIESSCQMGRHLIELGHRHICLVVDEKNWEDNRPAIERVPGVCKAFRGRGAGSQP